MGSHRAFIILSCMCLTNPPTLHIKSQKYFIFNVHGGLGEGSKAHINLQDCTGIMAGLSVNWSILVLLRYVGGRKLVILERLVTACSL